MMVQPLKKQVQGYLDIVREGNNLASLNLLIAPSLAGNLLLPENRPLTAVHRLVVLLPDQDVDETELASRIWALAAPSKLAILLIGAVSQENKAYVRRRLTHLTTLLRDDRIHIETTTRNHPVWLQALQECVQPGDLIVCHVEQKLSSIGLIRRNLAPLILSTFNIPVYVMSGLYPGLAVELAAPLSRWISAVVPMLIIVGFFFLQIQIDMTNPGWAEKALLMLSVLVEVALIGLWEGVI